MMNDEEKKQEMLGRTLREVRSHVERRDRRRRTMGSAAMVAVVAAAGVMVGVVTSGNDQPAPVVAGTSEPLQVSGVSTLLTSGQDEVASWSSPSALVLVVNADGMEMRVLNDSQVRALARKPGCEFSLTPDAVMWVSEVADDPERFDLLMDF